MTTLQDPLAEAPAQPTRTRLAWPWLAVLASVAAGAVHIAAAVTHQASGPLHVVFFLLVGFGQLALASALAVGLARVTDGERSSERSLHVLLLLAILGTIGLLALYLVVHTTDLLTGLIGSHQHAADGAGHSAPPGAVAQIPPIAGLPTEPPDTLGTINVAVELLAITAYTAVLPRSWRPRVTNALLLFGVLAWLLWLTGGLS